MCDEIMNLKDVFKTCRFPFIVSILTLLIELSFPIFCLGTSFKYTLILLGFGLLPFLFFSFLTMFFYKHKEMELVKSSYNILTLIFLCGLLIYYPFIIILSSFLIF